MRTLGVDPTCRLVAPRMVAMVLVAPVLSVLIIVIAVAASFRGGDRRPGSRRGSYWQPFGAYALDDGPAICILKSVAFGFVVSSSRLGGLDERRRIGVADAVNASSFRDRGLRW